MNTSYFAKYKGEHAVSIARGTPAWFKGRTYNKLAPTWNMVQVAKSGKKAEFAKKYSEMLSMLDAKEVYEELGEDAVLVCWEKSGDFCHRYLVAEWLERELGLNIKIEEWDREI